MKMFITARKRSLRRLCFYTCLSVHRGRSTWAGTPWQVHPPGMYTPPRQVHPPDRYPLLGRYPQAGTPTGAGTPPGQVHTPWAGMPPGRNTPWTGTPHTTVHLGYGQQSGGTHPTGMHSCFDFLFPFNKNYFSTFFGKFNKRFMERNGTQFYFNNWFAIMVYIIFQCYSLNNPEITLQVQHFVEITISEHNCFNKIKN